VPSTRRRKSRGDGESTSLVRFVETMLTYSRQQKDELLIRGRKLILNYTDGSPCPAHATTKRSTDLNLFDPPPLSSRHANAASNDHIYPPHKSPYDRDSSSTARLDPYPMYSTQASQRRKSSIFSLLCDRDPTATKASVSFVGASEDECTYFFELRSSAACPAVNVQTQQVGPSAVFGLM